MESELFDAARDALKAKGLCVIEPVEVEEPEGRAMVILTANDQSELGDLLDLVTSLGGSTVLMERGEHGAFTVHIVGRPWVEVLIMTEAAVAALTEQSVGQEQTHEAVEALVEAVEDAIATFPVSRHSRGPFEIIDKLTTSIAARDGLSSDVETAARYELQHGESEWYDELVTRHSGWIRDNAADLAAQVLRDHPQPPGRVSKTLQRQTVREWMKSLDPACSTLPVIEPVVVAFGELLDARD